MKKLVLAFLGAVLAVSTITNAHAVKLTWIEKNKTVIFEDTVQVSKPTGKWDTQTKYYKDPAPVKWVRHVAGANPQIFLRYTSNVKGKTAHVYATKIVKKELEGRGIAVSKIEKKVINNRHVAIIHGSMGNERYMVGVWRHENIGFQLECLAISSRFDEFMGQFNEAIESVKILKERDL